MESSSLNSLAIQLSVVLCLNALQPQPDVMEVEVNADGQWRRVASAEDPWTAIDADPASIPAPTAVKQEANAIEVCSKCLAFSRAQLIILIQRFLHERTGMSRRVGQSCTMGIA